MNEKWATLALSALTFAIFFVALFANITKVDFYENENTTIAAVMTTSRVWGNGGELH